MYWTIPKPFEWALFFQSRSSFMVSAYATTVINEKTTAQKTQRFRFIAQRDELNERESEKINWFPVNPLKSNHRLQNGIQIWKRPQFSIAFFPFHAWATFNLIFIERKKNCQFVSHQLMTISCIINLYEMFDYGATMVQNKKRSLCGINMELKFGMKNFGNGRKNRFTSKWIEWNTQWIV